MNDLEVISQHELDQMVIDQGKAKDIAEVLEKHYPGYGWAVNVDSANNIGTIRALTLAGEWGFYIHLNNIDPEGRLIVKCGGEILERYRVKRGSIDQSAVSSLKRDLRGNAEADLN